MFGIGSLVENSTFFVFNHPENAALADISLMLILVFFTNGV